MRVSCALKRGDHGAGVSQRVLSAFHHAGTRAPPSRP
jgi:hypothetical protein